MPTGKNKVQNGVRVGHWPAEQKGSFASWYVSFESTRIKIRWISFKLFRVTYDQHKYYAFFCVTVLVLPWVIRISNGLFSAATLDNHNTGYAVSQAHL